MVKYRITVPELRSCHISLPPSKSVSNRVLIIGALGGSFDNIRNLATCNDTRTMMEALQSTSHIIDVNDAGTAMRFLTAYFALTPGSRIITGSQRMQERPIEPLVTALRQMGANITYCNKEGYPPLRIEGCQLHGGDISIRGDVSSQFISAILLIAPYLQEKLTITIEGEILSKPYIDMTIILMKYYNISVSYYYNRIEISPGKYSIEKELEIPFDWTAASYWYEISYLCSTNEERVNNLYYFNSSHKSLQGDENITEIFDRLGVKTEFDTSKTTIYASQESVPPHILKLDLRNNPDVAQTIILGCVLRKQFFEISGLHNLRIKETDRITALINETAKLGVVLTEPCEGTLRWMGECCPIEYPIIIDTHGDHRMAMAFAPAAITHGEIWIDNPQVVDKSYPDYWKDLSKAGFYITDIKGKEITT